jgi:hypothetical protein
MVLRSAVYQRDSEPLATVAISSKGMDTQNRWLGHFPRVRMEGEAIRDAALAVSGKLNFELGGPSVFPELPPGMESRGGWKVSGEAGAVDRRSVYVFVRRNTRYPMFETFDMPDTHETCSRRNVTTSPVQALSLLNSRLTHEWAQSYAGRVVERAGSDVRAQVDVAWAFAYSRKPSESEQALALEFLQTQRGVIEERVSKGEPIALPDRSNPQVSKMHAAALVDLCHALLNSNEFVYRD